MIYYAIASFALRYTLKCDVICFQSENICASFFILWKFIFLFVRTHARTVKKEWKSREKVSRVILRMFGCQQRILKIDIECANLKCSLRDGWMEREVDFMEPLLNASKISIEESYSYHIFTRIHGKSSSKLRSTNDKHTKCQMNRSPPIRLRQNEF